MTEATESETRGWYEFGPRTAFVTLLSLKSKVEELEERIDSEDNSAKVASLQGCKSQREQALREFATQLYSEGTLSEEDAQSNDLMQYVDDN